MNSVKNAIVTMTLLAVGYGAYVVLNNPAPESIEGISESEVWAAPEVSTSLVDGTLDAATDAATSTLADLPGDARKAMDAVGSEMSTVDDVESAGSRWASGESTNDGDSTYGDIQSSTDGGTGPLDEHASLASASYDRPSADEFNAAEGLDSDDDRNYYAAEAGATDDPSMATDSRYPVTDAADLPLGNPRGSDVAGNSSFSSSDDSNRTADRAADATDSGFEATWQSVQADVQSGQLGNALLSLSAWYGEPSLTTEQRDRCLNQLDQLAGAVIYSRDSFLEPAHVVQHGETLSDVARQYGVASEFLARVNGVSTPNQLRFGETLKVVRGPFRAEVDRNAGMLTLYIGRYYAGRFKVKTGEALPPGSASYEIVSVEAGHPYFDSRTGDRVDSDDPANPYGARWLGLRGNQSAAADEVGIHVDKNAGSQITSIAVSAVDADDLSVILTVGSRVDVRN